MRNLLTPFAGISPGSEIRTSGGSVLTGKVHAAAGLVTTDPDGFTALCGRSVRALVIYRSEDWSKMVAEHERLHRTHQVHTCHGCVRRTPAEVSAA